MGTLDLTKKDFPAVFLDLGLQGKGQGQEVNLGSGREGSVVQLKPNGFANSPDLSLAGQPPGGRRGWGLPLHALCGGLWASRSSRWKALAQTENKVCPVAGGGEEGPMVRGRYLVAALPRAPFLAKCILVGKQWCWTQVVNWEGRGARKLSVLSLCPSF